MFDNIFTAYGLDGTACKVNKLDAGLINYTWKITSGNDEFILQRINRAVFSKPENIAANTTMLSAYAKNHAPEYLFVAPLLSKTGNAIVESGNGDIFRLFPFVRNSHTVNSVDNVGQAYEAAKQFGTFTRLFKHFDPSLLNYTLPNFHNLSLRLKQFDVACKQATASRLNDAKQVIVQIHGYENIAAAYKNLVENELLSRHVIHHDTKISNVLFDDKEKGLCVIDLDTVMPGYFISDVGDMLRTYLSPANEEEQDFSKIKIRPEYFNAIYKGYMEQMGSVLTAIEKENFLYAGKFMIYMQAIRFITDFLNNDIYYQIKYPEHNLRRAQNQLYFLDQYVKAEPGLVEVIDRSPVL